MKMILPVKELSYSVRHKKGRRPKTKGTAPSEDRTHDFQIMRLALCRLSYRSSYQISSSSFYKHFYVLLKTVLGSEVRVRGVFCSQVVVVGKRQRITKGGDDRTGTTAGGKKRGY